MRFFLRYWIPVIATASIIFFISSIPEPPVPTFEIPHLDKVFHFLEYGVLAFLLRRAMVNGRSPFWQRYASLAAVLFALIYGVSDELHQSFIPHRSPEFLDLLFDGAGAIAAQFLPFVITRRRL